MGATSQKQTSTAAPLSWRNLCSAAAFTAACAAAVTVVAGALYYADKEDKNFKAEMHKALAPVSNIEDKHVVGYAARHSCAALREDLVNPCQKVKQFREKPAGNFFNLN